MKRVVFAFLPFVLAFAACEKRSEEVRVYRLEKAPLEEAPAIAGGNDSMSAAEMPPSHPPITTAPVTSASVSSVAAAPALGVPSNWEAQPLSEMRKASYVVHGAAGASADISFVALGGSAGDLLANVNRWLGQLGQPAITDAQLPQMVQRLPSELGQVAVVDLKGLPEQGDPKKDGRIVAAIASGNGSTEFYKMRGNTAVCEAEKENFINWVTAMRAHR